MNNVFYIIGAGPSFLDVTEEEWEYLSKQHTICFARVPYGSRKTEYYFSIERDYLDKSVLSYMAKLGYLNTKLILHIPESINLARKLGFKDIRWVNKETFYFMPSRLPWFTDEESPPNSFLECRAKVFRHPIFRYRGQLIAVINACLILGATEIRLIGVDLNSQDNFYDTEYLYTCCKDKSTIDEYIAHRMDKKDAQLKRHTDKYPQDIKYDSNTMHTTNMPYIEKDKFGDRQLRGVADVLQWIDKSLREEGHNGIFITNKNSLLYKENKLQYKSII